MPHFSLPPRSFFHRLLNTPSRFVTVCAITLFSLTLPAQAEETPPHTDGHQIHFSVTQSQSVANDTVDVVFRHNAQGQTPQQVMQEINRQMQAALRELRLHSDIQTQSSRYRVYPVHNKQRIITHWKGEQSLTLTTKNQESLGKILVKIEPYLTYHSMNFRVSDTKRQRVIRQLTTQALKAYQSEAQRIADSFHSKPYRFIETRIHQPGIRPVYSERALMARTLAASAPPAVEAGESVIRLQVDGTLLLPD